MVIGVGHISPADVDVSPAITIKICDQRTRSDSGTSETRSRAHILEPQTALIEIQSLGLIRTGEHEVRQTIIIHVTHGHSSAIVSVEVAEDVEAICLDNLIRE